MLIGVVDICMPETLNLHTLSNTMNYNMFKLQVQLKRLGDWVDVTNSTADCPTVYELWEYYTNRVKCNNYRIVPVN